MRAQVAVASLQAVQEVVRGLLQIAAVCLGDADVYAMREGRLSVTGRAEGPRRRKPNRSLL